MTARFKKMSVLSLSVIFLSFTVFCCCLTDIVEARPAVPSCHQTEQASDSPHDSQDCDCHKDPLLTQSGISFNSAPVEFVVFLPPRDTSPTFNLVSRAMTDQGPPPLFGTSPLYIKYSILRV